MELIDSHTHLFLEEFDDDRKEMLQRAKKKEVKKFFLPNIDVSTITRLKKMTETFPESCYPMMGLHPGSVKKDYKKQLDTIYKHLCKEKYYAVGEIGIDLYWDKSYQKEQEDAFSTQIQWAKELHLPIVIHARNSFDEIFKILDRLNDENLTGILHCFTGNKEQAEHINDYGNFYLGIGGIVTFKNGGLDKTLKNISLDCLLLETDSPYLAPVPNRGKRNESAFIYEVAQKLAEIYNCPIEDIAQQTTKNAKVIFQIQ